MKKVIWRDKGLSVKYFPAHEKVGPCQPALDRVQLQRLETVGITESF